MPLTENQIRLTAAGACLLKVSVITGPEKLFYAYRVYIYDQKLNMPSDPKSYRDFPARVLQKIRFSFTTSILVKVKQIIWWSIWIQKDFDINSAYFT